MVACWRRFLSRLGLSRAGRAVFSVVLVLGAALVIADDVVPRSGSEAGLGPTVAAIVGVYTVMALGLVVLVDRAFQTIAAFISRYRSRG